SRSSHHQVLFFTRAESADRHQHTGLAFQLREFLFRALKAAVLTGGVECFFGILEATLSLLERRHRRSRESGPLHHRAQMICRRAWRSAARPARSSRPGALARRPEGHGWIRLQCSSALARIARRWRSLAHSARARAGPPYSRTAPAMTGGSRARRNGAGRT